MALETETIDICPAILISYKLDKLKLDNIQDDQCELSNEIPQSDSNLDAEDDILPEYEITESADSKSSENCVIKPSTMVDKSCIIEVKVDLSRNTNRKIDIHGNEEHVLDENLSQLIFKLDLSDSDNEVLDDGDSSKCRERGPVRQTRRNRHQNNILSRNESQDTAQLNSERLRFLCGSNLIQSNEISPPNQSAIHSNVIPVFNGSESVHTSPCQSLFYDAMATLVNSPESGYDSSAQSISGSPPPITSTSLDLNIIPETIDKDFSLDIFDIPFDALTDNNVPACNIGNEDAKTKIDKIREDLKNSSAEFLESLANAAAISYGNVPDCEPLVNHPEDLNTNYVTLPPYDSVSRYMETPKRLVYKLDDKAKHALRDFLCSEKFYAAIESIYKKIIEDLIEKKNVKVIYVEDEMDKASENRTNLHRAVLESKLEDIYCLVEIHKQYNKPLTDINIRDKYGKTALDYAVQKQMIVVVDYLKENTACQNVKVPVQCKVYQRLAKTS